MVTEEEKRDIIELAKQEFMLLIPELMGSLMSNHAAMAKMNAEFYKKYPEFREHKDTVVEVMSMIDGEDTLAAYEDKLKKAVPLIRERIGILKRLDLVKVDAKPNRLFQDFPTSGSDNGVF